MHSTSQFAVRAFWIATALGAVSQLSCASQPHRFPLREPYWVDNDTRPLAHQPREYWSPLVWDAVDHQFFRPITRALLLETNHEAANVNAMDEVPDSSWYTNRLATHRLSPAEIAEGPCADQPMPSADQPWTILSGKPNGASPGFIARGPDGRRYVVKTDSDVQPGQNTSAEVIAARVFWAAGFNVPCNRILHARRELFRLGEHAYYENEVGQRIPMTVEQTDPIFAMANPGPDGTRRLSISLFVEGRPLGPFRYESTRPDDPNDVVPHEDRRDLRGSRLVSAWLNHWDSREQNTLTTWIPVGDRGYVRHYIIDLGDCMGGLWPIDGLARRIGYSGYFDVGHISQDFFSLGLINRPWDHVDVDREGWPWGYYRAEPFDPAAWRGGYPNPAYTRMTERDGAWMARIIARLSDDHIHAIVGTAEIAHQPWADALERALRGRRDRILSRYLTRVSPLADVAISESSVCANDRGVEGRVYPNATYSAFAVNGRAQRGASLAVESPAPGRVCVRLPDHTASARNEPGYGIVEIVTTPPGGHALPLYAHVYDLGPSRGYALAGIER